jgi:hypothetical protein
MSARAGRALATHIKGEPLRSSQHSRRIRTIAAGTTLASTAALAMGLAAPAAQANDNNFIPGDLVYSSSTYMPADITPGVTELAPGCAGTAAASGTPCHAAIADGTFPFVFNNDSVDGSFGIVSPLFLNQITPWGKSDGTIPVPSDQLNTSFSSKSEGALNLSTDGKELSFIDYSAPVDTIDASNANTPGAPDPTNPVGEAFYRTAATVDQHGNWTFTRTNAYSGNNGRAAILNSADNIIYTAGNAGNGGNPQPNLIIAGAGAQMLTRSTLAQADQTTGNPTPVGSFNITELGDTADKVGKDDNFRGLTIHDNVLYYTKGSGGNGVNTVYFLDTTGTACPHGVGVPSPDATLPTTSIAYDNSPAVPPATLSNLQKNGLANNMCILAGFPTILAKKDTAFFPFGIWFANDTTLYVANEGAGDATFVTNPDGSYTYVNSTPAANPNAGVEKWSFDSTTQQWKYAYTIQNGLDLGTPYTVNGYPTGLNSGGKADGPWAPATNGLRNITGHINRDGTVDLYGITSTVSGSGDQGADPNKLVKVTDVLSATNPGTEVFTTLEAAGFGQVLRGVSFTPGTGNGNRTGNGH